MKLMPLISVAALCVTLELVVSGCGSIVKGKDAVTAGQPSESSAPPVILATVAAPVGKTPSRSLIVGSLGEVALRQCMVLPRWQRLAFDEGRGSCCGRNG